MIFHRLIDCHTGGNGISRQAFKSNIFELYDLIVSHQCHFKSRKKRMSEIHEFTRKIFRDHIYGVEESISNTASVATLS